MFPRWHSSTLVAPSSIGCRSAAPVRIAATKLSMCRAVMSSSAPADGGAARGVAAARRRGGDVDLVRAVVADLARAPAREQRPIVVNDVVAVRGMGRRALPQLVVQVGGGGRRFPPADRAPSVGIPGAREVGLPDSAFFDRLHDVDRAGRGALLRPHLHYASVLAVRLDE